MRYLRFFIFLFLFGNILTGCFDDNDDIPRISSTTEINDFIHRGLRFFYLYKEDVPDLLNNRFSSNQEYTDFLNSSESPSTFFNSLISNQDEFSRLLDDYTVFELSLDGVTKNNGMEFGLFTYPNNPSNVFGFVNYVLPNTDAEAKGVQRGYVFNTINGTQITPENFRQLINLETYTIGLASFDGSDITPTGQSIALSKVQYTENPVFISKTMNIGGNPVGYLMYTRFTGDFDPELNSAFAQFKTDRITDLVLDLRYNGGGSVETAIDLSSMITGQFNGKIFITEEWNPEIQEVFENDNPELLINRFDNQTRNGNAINSLNLNRIYILSTRRTASASELVINGLDPYITVIQVGTTSRGKFQASRTVYDSDNFRRLGANIGHTYALQPLIFKSLNSLGFTDYFNGFTPEIEIAEDFTNPGILGDENEPLLKAALDNILGNTLPAKHATFKALKTVGSSDMLNLDYERMYKDTNL